MTGESLPVDKEAGDEVSSGTVNQFGAFDMRAERVGADSSIQRMIQLVKSADAGKAKIVGLADRWATWIVVGALGAAFFTWLLSGEVIRAVTILVVFCPCALVLATPTAIMAAIGNATGHGFLVREGDALEKLANVKKIAFDKTGTLTYGTPEVKEVISVCGEYSADEIYALGAAAESFSEHPLGKAVVRCFKNSGIEKCADAENFRMIPGRGIEAEVGGAAVMAGNRKMMSENMISAKNEDLEKTEKYLNLGCSVIYICIYGKFCGFIALADTLREDSRDMIAKIKAAGLEPVLLTGDNESAAEAIAEKIGIREKYSGCLSEDKLKFITKCHDEAQMVCMIGDGINDAPALKCADVGIAMGGVGSDIAVDAADIVLVDDEVGELVHLVRMSKRMMTTIKCNLTFSMGLNFLAIILAITGILNPVAGALVHNAGSVAVIINSALLLRWKKK